MLSDFSVKFDFSTVNNCISNLARTQVGNTIVYAINTLNNEFLVTYNDSFIWISIQKCKLYDPILEDDYDDY